MNEEYIEKPNKNNLATASLILGVVAALGFIFVFPPFVFGATAIVLGLLSKTGDMMSMRSKIGICMGALSMILLCFVLGSAIHLLMTDPNLLKEFNDNFNDIYQNVYGIPGEGGYV